MIKWISKILTDLYPEECGMKNELRHNIQNKNHKQNLLSEFVPTLFDNKYETIYLQKLNKYQGHSTSTIT